MFMQSIRRATKKHRKVLLAVVILLLVGLVSSFGIWNSISQGSTGVSNTTGDDITLEQQITAYLEYIETLKPEAVDYSGCLNLASTYKELGYLYANKYSMEMENVPEASQPVYDEEGNEVPLGPVEEAARSAKEAERQTAISAAEVWMEYGKNAAIQAETYYQQALDKAPAELNDAGIANIKASQAETRDMQGDTEGALAFMKEAYELTPDNSSYLVNLAYLEQALGNLEEALARYEEASALYPENASFVAAQASLQGEMGNNDQARELYQQARAMAPEDYNIAYYYAMYIFNTGDYEGGVAELQAYRDALPEGHLNIEQADANITYLQSLADMFASLVVQGGEAVDDDLETENGEETTGEEITDREATDEEATNEEAAEEVITEEEIPDQL